jgi:hypothetical protein
MIWSELFTMKFIYHYSLCVFLSLGKADKGEYSPQAQEKDLEMSRKIDEGAEEPGNLYEDVDVIKNPNAERLI